MNLKLMPITLKFGGLDQFGMRDFDLIQLTFQAGLPKTQKFAQNRKTRSDIQFLPNKALHQFGVIGQAVNNLGRRQAVIVKLFFKTVC